MTENNRIKKELAQTVWWYFLGKYHNQESWEYCSNIIQGYWVTLPNIFSLYPHFMSKGILRVWLLEEGKDFWKRYVGRILHELGVLFTLQKISVQNGLEYREKHKTKQQ